MSTNNQFEQIETAIFTELPQEVGSQEEDIPDTNLTELDFSLCFDKHGRVTELGKLALGIPDSKPPQPIVHMPINWDEYPHLAEARETLAIAREASRDLVIMDDSILRWNGHTTEADIET